MFCSLGHVMHFHVQPIESFRDESPGQILEVTQILNCTLSRISHSFKKIGEKSVFYLFSDGRRVVFHQADVSFYR